MSRQPLAITNCRVSSDEQLLNNSLNRQGISVQRAADKLGAQIIKTWSGSVSSKAGTNIKRKDLLAMLEFCKKHKQVKYAIFDEYDRYMRSVNEGPYFEVLFQQLGVKVWYASESDTFNGDDAMAKFMRSMSAFKAEGSNEERQRKSISGQYTAMTQGRYPFAPKPGYKKGQQRGIQEIHDVRGPILKATLLSIVTRRVTPTQALIDFNDSAFMKGHSPYKMDKFRHIVTDPFYAGIVEMDKQVKCRNENGLHDPLITKEQHNELLRIMDDKKKNQRGPNKHGNPLYPCNNIVSCVECKDEKNGRLVGFNHGNGKENSTLVYQKYRCRACGRYLSKDELHGKIEAQFSANPISAEGLKKLLAALETVWKQNEGQAAQEAIRLEHKVKTLNESIAQQVEAITDPGNLSIKQEILASIEKKKDEITKAEEKLVALTSHADNDKVRFLEFAFDFVDNMGSRFLDTTLVSKENRLRCKQVVFPAGFWVDNKNKVYTPEISRLITLAATKKDTEVSNNVQMVRVRGL